MKKPSSFLSGSTESQAYHALMRTSQHVRAAIYVRVSSDEQVEHGYGLEIQQQAIEQYASSQGYEVNPNHIYREE